MLQIREARALPLSHGSSDDWIKLIRKLRWIGLEEEAQRLQHAVSTLHGVNGGCVLAERAAPSSAPIPKFASVRRTLECELRNRKEH